MIYFLILRCCLAMKTLIGYGFLCEGEVNNPPSTPKRILWYIRKNNNRYIESVKLQFDLGMIHKNNKTSYRYVLFDKANKYKYFFMENLDFYSTFEFFNNGTFYKVPGIFDKKENFGTTKISEKMYEATVTKLSTIFVYIIYNYYNSRNKEFAENLKDYQNLNESLHQECASDNMPHDIFVGKNLFMKVIEHLISHDEEYDRRKKTSLLYRLKSYYNVENTKVIIKDNDPELSSFDEAYYKFYMNRCFSIMDEASLFFGYEKYSNYSLTEKDFTFTLKARKFSVIYFKFDIEKVTKTKKIYKENLLFHDEKGKHVIIDYNDIKVFNYISPTETIVLVKEDILRCKGVKYLTIEKFRIYTIDISEYI